MVNSIELISELNNIKKKLLEQKQLTINDLNNDEKFKLKFIKNIINAAQRRMREIKAQIDYEFNETCSNINFKLMNNQNLKKQDELYFIYLNIFNSFVNNNYSLIKIIEGLILAVVNGDCLTFNDYYEIEDLLKMINEKFN